MLSLSSFCCCSYPLFASREQLDDTELSKLTPALVEAFEREARASAATKRSAQNAVGGGLSWDE